MRTSTRSYTKALMILLSLTVAMLWPPRDADAGTAVTIAEAYHIAKPAAIRWNPDARLYHIISADTVGNTDHHQGTDGRRRLWNLDFVIPGTERHLTVYVYRRRVQRTEEFRNPNRWAGYDDLPAIPIDKVLSRANQVGLQPAGAVAFGIHFRLLYVSKQRGVELWVYGQSRKGGRNVLRFNPRTGEPLR
jgi:hypothetical protein